MNSHLIANSRPGRKAAVIHLANIGCPALAQAKYTRTLGDERSLSEVLRNAIAIATAFKPMTICRKCRAAARQILAVAAKRAALEAPSQPVIKSVPLVVEMGETIAYGSVHHQGCRAVKDPMRIGETPHLSEVPDLLMDATGWEEYTVEELTLCLCAKTRLS